jgi:hypothetical protein
MADVQIKRQASGGSPAGTFGSPGGSPGSFLAAHGSPAKRGWGAPLGAMQE